MSYLIIYLIKSTVYLALFYAFFLTVMRGTTFFRFNRIMLLIGTFVCMLLPLHTVTVNEVEGIQLPMQVLDEMLVSGISHETEAEIIPSMTLPVQTSETTESIPLLPYLLTGVYLIGVIVFLTTVVRSFRAVWKLIISHPKQWKDGYWLVIIPDKISSFSWSNYIVMSREDYENYPQIMVHEQMHYLCRHSYDILFMTLINAIHWFNPMVWLMRNELKQLHEFEADQGVINQGIDATQYQLLLVRKAVGKKLYNIANGFNHTKLKKRITMMIKEKTNGWERLKWLVSVPVMMGAMFVFAQPEVKDTLEEIAPVVNQEDTKTEIASLRQFYREQNSAWADRVRRPDGTVVLQSGRVHTLFITPESKVTLEEQVLTSNYQQAIQNFLREAKIADKRKTGKDEPQHILFKYSIKADENLVLQVLRDIKAAYTEVRAEYSRQGVKDIEAVCPYVVSTEGPYEYWPGGVEITVTSADGSQKITTNEFKWKVFTQLRNELGPDSKVTFKSDKNAPEFMFKFVQDRLKDLFKNVQEEKAFSKKIDVSLFDSKSKSTLIDLKDLRYLSDLSKALNVLPKHSDISVSLKADKDTPMGDITEVKQVLRNHYICKLNMTVSDMQTEGNTLQTVYTKQTTNIR